MNDYVKIEHVQLKWPETVDSLRWVTCNHMDMCLPFDSWHCSIRSTKDSEREDWRTRNDNDGKILEKQLSSWKSTQWISCITERHSYHHTVRETSVDCVTLSGRWDFIQVRSKRLIRWWLFNNQLTYISNGRSRRHCHNWMYLYIQNICIPVWLIVSSFSFFLPAARYLKQIDDECKQPYESTCLEEWDKEWNRDAMSCRYLWESIIFFIFTNDTMSPTITFAGVNHICGQSTDI